MRARRDNRRAGLELQALYSVNALARFAHVSPDMLRRVLRANGVRFVCGGRSLLVPLSEIALKIPPLWESIRAAEEQRQAARNTRPT